MKQLALVETKSAAKRIPKVTLNGEQLDIKHQEKASDDWQLLILGHSNPNAVGEQDQLEFDGL